MYAVIHTGGKQYRVAKNDVIQVEKLPGAAGETIELDRVLMLGDGAEATIGAPLVDGALVSATILEQMRGPKIIVFKKKRRKNYRRTKGHRQDLTVLRITDIVAAGSKPAKAKAKPAAEEAKPETAATPAPAKEAKAAKSETPAKAANDADKPKASEASTKATKSAKTKTAKDESPAKAGRGSSEKATSEESSEESK